MSLNKHGNCPNCGKSWDDGDVFEEIDRLEVFINSSKNETLACSSSFGWSQENPVRFSKVKTTQIKDRTFYQCHNIRCGRIYDAETSKEYYSVQEAIKEGETIVVDVAAIPESPFEEAIQKLQEQPLLYEPARNTEEQSSIKTSEEETKTDAHEQALTKPINDNTNFNRLSQFLSGT